MLAVVSLSTRYLLPVQNVIADYKDEFTAFLQRQGVNVTVDNNDKKEPVTSDMGEGELPDEGESELAKKVSEDTEQAEEHQEWEILATIVYWFIDILPVRPYRRRLSPVRGKKTKCKVE